MNCGLPTESPRHAPGLDLAGLVFDFDGTLAELNLDFSAMRRQVEDLARALGFAEDWPPGYLLEQVEMVAGRLGDGFAQRAHQLIQEREMAAAHQGLLFAFTRPLLASLAREGIKVGIISRNCGPAIRLVYPQIEDECPVFLPREAVSRPKPHPDHVRAALERLGVPADRAAMVGDHPTDQAAARAAGCLAVGVTSGRSTREELAGAGAHVIMDNAWGVLELLPRAASGRVA